MRILFNCLNLNKGGAERVINILSNSLVDNNEVKIITNTYSNIEYKFDDKIQIDPLIKRKDNLFLRKIRRISPILLFKLKKKVEEYNPDVIISFLPEANFRILLLKKMSKKIRNIPVIISVRNDPNTEYKKRAYFYIMKKLYPLSNQMILQTDDAKKYFEEKINFSGVVIQNPVSEKFLKNRYTGIREKKIVAVGRLDPQKNYELMIDAFEIVSKKHNDFVFHIYGDGKLKDKLQNYINDKKLEEKVILKGKVNNIEDEIYKATAFVMSSDYEGMPNALLEAACIGVPCVSTDCPCGGPRKILENGKNGILVPIKNVKKLANGICEIIENPKLANEFSKKSNNNSKIYFKDNVVQEWNKNIQNLLKNR